MKQQCCDPAWKAEEPKQGKETIQSEIDWRKGESKTGFALNSPH